MGQGQTFTNVQPIPQTFTNVQPIGAPVETAPAEQGDQRGAAESFANSFGVDPKKGAGEQLMSWAKGLGYTVSHPVDALKLIGQGMNDAQKAEFKKSYEATDKGHDASALSHFLYGMLPAVGPALGDAATQMEQGNIRGGLGTTAGVATQIFAGSPEARGAAADVVRAPLTKVGELAGTESNPNVLYQKYLAPIASKPFDVPVAPKAVVKAVLRDMEAAGDDAAAARLRSGTATAADLDIARQSANRLATSIYRSPGNYPPGLAKGADAFADSIRNKIYPEMEQANGLPSGSLRDIKRLQGDLMASERTPSLTKKLITGGIGAGGGAALGYEIAGTPGAYVGAAVGSKVAEPIAGAVDRGIIGARTKVLSARLPAPVARPAPALAPNIAGQLPAAPTELGASTMTGAPSTPPFVAPTTRAQRLGLLLPSKTGGPVELPYQPEMTSGERVAASDARFRQRPQPALPAKSAPIQLPSGMKVDPITGLPLNPDGTVTVYHGTTKAGAAAIRSTNKLTSAAEPDVYVTTDKTSNPGYGDGTVVAVRVHPSQLILDDEFPNGRRDFRINTGKIGGSVDVAPEPQLPEKSASATASGKPVDKATAVRYLKEAGAGDVANQYRQMGPLQKLSNMEKLKSRMDEIQRRAMAKAKADGYDTSNLQFDPSTISADDF